MKYRIFYFIDYVLSYGKSEVRIHGACDEAERHDDLEIYIHPEKYLIEPSKVRRAIDGSEFEKKILSIDISINSNFDVCQFIFKKNIILPCLLNLKFVTININDTSCLRCMVQMLQQIRTISYVSADLSCGMMLDENTSLFLELCQEITRFRYVPLFCNFSCMYIFNSLIFNSRVRGAFFVCNVLTCENDCSNINSFYCDHEYYEIFPYKLYESHFLTKFKEDMLLTYARVLTYGFLYVTSLFYDYIDFNVI